MRAPQVTRTIQSTEATILCLDIEAAEPCNRTFTLPRTYKSDKDILKTAERMNTEPNIKLVHVVDIEIREKLYGMSEADFIKYASVIEKPTQETTETTETTETN